MPCTLHIVRDNAIQKIVTYVHIANIMIGTSTLPFCFSFDSYSVVSNAIAFLYYFVFLIKILQVFLKSYKQYFKKVYVNKCFRTIDTNLTG